MIDRLADKMTSRQCGWALIIVPYLYIALALGTDWTLKQTHRDYVPEMHEGAGWIALLWPLWPSFWIELMLPLLGGALYLIFWIAVLLGIVFLVAGGGGSGGSGGGLSYGAMDADMN